MTTYTATIDGAPASWSDRKRLLWLLGLVVPLLPLAGAWLALGAGVRLGWWIGPLWVVAVVPLLDALAGTDRSNPPDWAYAHLDADRYYRWCTFAFVPLQYAALIAGCWLAMREPSLQWLDKLGLCLTVGTSGGVGIATAHELGHKKTAFERWLARIVLAQSAYGHFFVEHNRGHHTRVATPEDPASARLGESFYAFWLRSVVGSFKSAWELEKHRLERHGTSPWSIHNQVLTAWAMTVALFGGLLLWLGPQLAPFLALQAVVGFSLLEVVNYLEHYGLLRQRDADGKVELCTPQHSWNSNHSASNLLLYHLQRHSDHHAWPARRYQALRHFQESPQLPSGYATMLLLACVPPLWRAVMDKRVVAHYGGDVRLANLQPSARERLLRTWPPPAP
ncbi:MAG: alkane 1-monooxygenase [Deltaproteobacteria bacterium]|nr:alkane 1-monooxygenase [Deltaproteobacteria bacterium]